MKKSIVLSIASLVFISGCANAPVSLGKVEAKNNIVATYARYPIYAATDKFSFTQAEVRYQATGGGFHTVQVGDYLLGEILESLKNSSVTLIRLNEFSSECVPDGAFLPKLMCSTRYLIEITEQGVTKTIGGSLPAINIGSMRARQTSTLVVGTVTSSDDSFHAQIKPVLLAVINDFSNRRGAAQQ